MGLEIAIDLSPLLRFRAGLAGVDQLIGLGVVSAGPRTRRVEERGDGEVGVAGDVAPPTIESFARLALAEEHVDPGGELEEHELRLESDLVEVLLDQLADLLGLRIEAGRRRDLEGNATAGLGELGFRLVGIEAVERRLRRP